MLVFSSDKRKAIDVLIDLKSLKSAIDEKIMRHEYIKLQKEPI